MTLSQGRLASEEHIRADLAAVYRLLAHFGWDDLIHTHASAPIPNRPGELLINRYGVLFREVAPEDLIAIDLDGALVGDIQAPLNTAGSVIHTAIHRERHDVGCVIHTHSIAGVALSCLDEGLMPLNQIALMFHGKVGYHAFEGIALDRSEQDSLTADLGDNHVLILRNHGLLVVGRTIAEAFSRIYHLERACRIQLDVLAAGRPFTVPDAAVCERTRRQYDADDDDAYALEWQALRRLVALR